MTGTPRSTQFHSRLLRDLTQLGLAATATRMGFLRHLRQIADYQEIPAAPIHRDWQRNWLSAFTYARDALDDLGRYGARLDSTTPSDEAS